MKYWAALNSKGKIIAVGFTIPGRKFNRRCFPFAVASFELWGAGGGRYCQLLVNKSPLKYKGKNIKNVPHSRIKKSKDYFSMFQDF